jgi:hypothetical protein
MKKPLPSNRERATSANTNICIYSTRSNKHQKINNKLSSKFITTSFALTIHQQIVLQQYNDDVHQQIKQIVSQQIQQIYK